LFNINFCFAFLLFCRPKPQKMKRKRNGSLSQLEKHARQNRASSERIFKVGESANYDERGECLSVSLTVCGSRNVDYSILITRQGEFTCTCPDYTTRGKDIPYFKCKHLYFTLRLVLGFPADQLDSISRERRWTQTENWYHQHVAKFNNIKDSQIQAPICAPEKKIHNHDENVQNLENKNLGNNDNTVANLNTVSEVANQNHLKESKHDAKVSQREYEGTECAICLEIMEKNTPLWTCWQCCGKSTHEDCMIMWASRQNNCVYCRTPLVVPLN
jgi:hypothetical protein